MRKQFNWLQPMKLAAVALPLFVISCKKSELTNNSLSATDNNGIVATVNVADPLTQLDPDEVYDGKVKMFKFEQNFKQSDKNNLKEYFGVYGGHQASYNDLKTITNPNGYPSVSDLDFQLWARSYKFVSNGNTSTTTLEIKPRSTTEAFAEAVFKVNGKTHTTFKCGGMINPEDPKMFDLMKNPDFYSFCYNTNNSQAQEVAPKALYPYSPLFFKTDKGDKTKYGMILMTQSYKKVTGGWDEEITPAKVEIWVQN